MEKLLEHLKQHGFKPIILTEEQIEDEYQVCLSEGITGSFLTSNTLSE